MVLSGIAEDVFVYIKFKKTSSHIFMKECHGLVFTYKSMTHLELMFVYGVRQRSRLIAHIYSVVPVPFIEKTFLSFLVCTGTLVKEPVIRYMLAYL